MTFIPCNNQDIWINLNHVKTITIEKSYDQYELRAYSPEDEGSHYLLDSFDTREEALQCLEYLLNEANNSQ